MTDGYQASDSEAHRDRKYTLPSPAKQFFLTYTTQLRLFTKGATLWIILALIALIPLIVISGIADELVITNGAKDPNVLMVLYLMLCPLITAIIVPLVIAEVLPSEFNDRSAYLNFALPQSRSTLFLGKFCAGMTVLIATYVLTYAVCMLMVITTGHGSPDIHRVAESIALVLVGVFACASTVYFMSMFLRKKTTIIALVTLMIVLPGIVALIYTFNKSIIDIMGYIPFLLPDYALFSLESNVTTLSIVGQFFPKPMPYPDIVVSCIIGIIWSVAFIGAGCYMFKRRQL